MSLCQGTAARVHGVTADGWMAALHGGSATHPPWTAGQSAQRQQRKIGRQTQKRCWRHTRGINQDRAESGVCVRCQEPSERPLLVLLLSRLLGSSSGLLGWPLPTETVTMTLPGR